nr:reverse transcriptase domain-containing protein [Tanacetum cinerariifolium]
MADNRTMEEQLQAPTEGYGEAIVILEINADHFEIKTNLLQLVQVNPYHGFKRENPHTHINNLKRITSTLKFRDVPNDVIKLMMFPYSLEGAARVWYDKESYNSILTWEDLARERFKEMLRACPHHRFTELTQIDTFYNGLNENDQDSLNTAAGGNLLSKTTREALHIIENKSKVHYSRNKPNVSRMNMISRENATVEESCVTCGGNHAYYNCDATNSNQSSVCATTGTYNQVAPQTRASNYMAPPGFAPMQNNSHRFNQNQGQGNNFNRGKNFHGNQSFQVPNQGFQNQPFQVPNNQIQQGFSNEFSSYKKANDQMMRNMQSQINSLKGELKNEIQNTMKAQNNVLMEQQNAFQNNLQIMLILLIPEPDVSKTLPKPNILYPSRLNDQKVHEKATNQIEKFFQIFQDLHFDISFTDALLLMPKFASTIKSLLANKDKWFELAKIPLNDNCLAMLLKKLPGNLGDPGKFLIPFVDFEADPRVPLILRRSFLRTGRALIDVYGEEITLRVNDKAVTFNLNQTTRYSFTYDDMPVNRIDVIDVAKEDYAHEMLGFSNNSLGGNSTLTFEPIISDTSPSFTPFEGSDFILEEIEAYLKDE